MKTSAKVFKRIIVGLALLAGTTAANADCEAVAKVRAIYTATLDSTSTPPSVTYVYLAPTGIFGPEEFWWFGFTFDNKTASQLASAHAENSRVAVTGDVATCPTSGTFESIGQIKAFFTID